METKAETHLSADCDWPHGHPCSRCRLSDKQELSTFAYAWASAPRGLRDFVEYDVARQWFEKGQRAGRASLAEDLLEMRRLTAERMVNHD